MTAPTPLDQDDLAARAADAGVPVEFDADHAYATIGGRVYRARLETTHACPPDGEGLMEGLMPCCGRTPFEVPRTDRMTLDADLVTCKGVTP